MKQTIRLTENELKQIITESVKRIIKEGIDDFDRHSGGIYVTINGVPMTKKQYLKYKRELEKKKAGDTTPQKAKKPKTPQISRGDEVNPDQLHAVVQKLVNILNKQNGITSLFTFHDHGERSFGPAAMDAVVGPFKIEMNAFAVAYRQLSQHIRNIESWGKNNEYAVYEEAYKLADCLKIMEQKLEELYDKAAPYIRKMAKTLQGNAAYEGRIHKKTGTLKELGLKQQLLCRSHMSLIKTLGSVEAVANEIETIAKKGANPLDYNPTTGKRR